MACICVNKDTLQITLCLHRFYALFIPFCLYKCTLVKRELFYAYCIIHVYIHVHVSTDNSTLLVAHRELLLVSIVARMLGVWLPCPLTTLHPASTNLYMYMYMYMHANSYTLAHLQCMYMYVYTCT